MIDSKPDSIESLLMRSKSLGSRGEVHEAAKDVEQALQKKRNLQVSSSEGSSLFLLASS